MRAVRDAIHAKLAAVSGITSLLSTYNGVTSINTTDRVPEGMPRTFIQVGVPLNVTTEDTKSEDGRSVLIDVDIVADETGNDSTVETLAELVHAALHYQTLSVTGWACWQVRCDPPRQLNTDQTLVGRRVPVTVDLTEE